MKAYIIKIELKDSEPLIWRKVIMPANATYNRLHQIIQCVTNFQSSDAYDAYHLYEFDLSEEDMLVTNDEEAYEEHKHYQNNKEMYEQRLKAMPPEMVEFAKRNNAHLAKEIKKPNHYKINEYLEQYKTIDYTYDFGDDWQFKITLEAIVDDYYFGYPTLLDGAETAPPEDVGGIPGFYEFLEIYHDENHPEHKKVKQWASEQNFRTYDPEHINKMLKFIKYEKTNWDKINHEHYKIIEDKYREQ